MAMQLSGSLNLTGSLNVSSSVNLSGSIIINKLTYPTFGFADGQYGVEVPTLGVNNVFSMQIPRTVYEYVKNDSGVTLLKGTPVHSTGTVGFNTLVIAASASNASTMPATFILAQDLDDAEEGLGIAIGAIQGVNTTGLTAGEPVYVGANGGWTQTKPTGSNLIQNLGIVTKVGNNGGGVILGAGRSNDVPNIQEGYFWAGNSGSVATAFATSSFALTSSVNVFFGKQSVSGALHVRDGITGSFLGNLNGTANFATYASTAAVTTNLVTNDTTLYPVFSQTAAPNTYVGLKSHESGSLYYNGVTRQLVMNDGGLVVSGSTMLSGSTTIIGTPQITGSLLVTGSITITSGSITMPHRPAFRIIGTGGEVIAPYVLSGSKVSVDYNQGNHFNTTNGLFTAPIAGLYQVNLVIRTNSNTNSTINQAIVYKQSSAIDTAQIMVEFAANTTMNHSGGSTITKLEVGDTLRAQVVVGTCSFDGNNNFSVAYIG